MNKITRLNLRRPAVKLSVLEAGLLSMVFTPGTTLILELMKVGRTLLLEIVGLNLREKYAWHRAMMKFLKWLLM